MTKEEIKEYNRLYYINNKEIAESFGYNELGNRNKSNN